ncbi:hypothetical protein J8273_3079 [Carpediemonas membranifera]|uniref:Uncharacterized protein n=1 Tax=Carpediemonas membranifera TaxID=201153 RepID=A0A8J6AVW4_9EUKA|nr:hypothetical protein J8273_3079 [Carpediemonas membranifera]|eukprot:KAG9395503.1 hypothetical protein J8273_3079 [Carpediemonas membranifera]
MPSKIYTVKASVNKAIGEINGGGDNNAPRRGNLEPGMRSFTQAKYTFTCLLACVSASAHALTPPRTVNLFDEEVLAQIVSIAQQKVSKAKAADRCRWIGDLAMWRDSLVHLRCNFRSDRAISFPLRLPERCSSSLS